MSFNQIINNILLSKRVKFLEEKEKKYQNFFGKNELIFSHQVNEFNKIWSYAVENIKFYSDYSVKHKLPTKIEKLSQLHNFPIITKEQLVDYFSLVENKFYLNSQIKTGGSSGKPASFPFDSKDHDSSWSRSYLGRGRLGIKPFHSTALVWGHSHLFEKNLSGKIKYYIRKLKDYQLNTIRLSAYDISDDSIESYINIIKSKNIRFLIGYTSCVVKIALKILEMNNNTVFDNLQSVVVTAENTHKADIRIIESAFNVKCDIEYGMAEAGVLGYSCNSCKVINFFWDDFIYQTNENNNLIITSIYNRYFPLIRYDTNDIVENEMTTDSLLSTNRIVGRSNDNLEILVNSKKITVHSEFFTHILKSIDNVQDFLIVQKDLNINIYYVSSNKDLSKVFFSKLEKEYKSINKEYFRFIDTKEINKPSSPSGKKKWVIVEK